MEESKAEVDIEADVAERSAGIMDLPKLEIEDLNEPKPKAPKAPDIEHSLKMNREAREAREAMKMLLDKYRDLIILRNKFLELILEIYCAFMGEKRKLSYSNTRLYEKQIGAAMLFTDLNRIPETMLDGGLYDKYRLGLNNILSYVNGRFLLALYYKRQFDEINKFFYGTISNRDWKTIEFSHSDINGLYPKYPKIGNVDWWRPEIKCSDILQDLENMQEKYRYYQNRMEMKSSKFTQLIRFLNRLEFERVRLGVTGEAAGEAAGVTTGVSGSSNLLDYELPASLEAYDSEDSLVPLASDESRLNLTALEGVEKTKSVFERISILELTYTTFFLKEYSILTFLPYIFTEKSMIHLSDAPVTCKSLIPLELYPTLEKINREIKKPEKDPGKDPGKDPV